jgi:hypothetical protein
MGVSFTDREAQVKTHRVSDAVAAARLYLHHKYQCERINVSTLHNTAMDAKITIVELNMISERLIWDTLDFRVGYDARD